MGLSRRAYAALRGVHESAVRKAIAKGRITTEADGTIEAGDWGDFDPRDTPNLIRHPE